MSAKTYEYIVVLKTTDTKWIDIISKIMLVIAVIFFSAWTNSYFISGDNSHGVMFMVISLLIIIWLIYCNNLSRRMILPHYRFALLLAACGWFFHDKILWASMLYLLAAVMEKPAKKNLEVAFDKEEIVINSYPKRQYSWSDLNNVVLKEGMLTLDFKTNKLLQRFVNDEVDNKIEDEFNSFCKEQIRLNN